MSDYKGPKTYMELSAWHANRMPFKTERVGQAFSNEFGFECGKAYYYKKSHEAWDIIVVALAEKFPEFYAGIDQ